MQLTAPVNDSVSVMEPAEHDIQRIVDKLLYCPAAHALQLTAPVNESVSVIEPG